MSDDKAQHSLHSAQATGGDMPSAFHEKSVYATTATPGLAIDPKQAQPTLSANALDRAGARGDGDQEGPKGQESGGQGYLVHEDTDFPEGGSEAWLVVLGSWLALFSCLGLMNTLATFESYISTHQLADVSTGTIGWIFSVNAFLCFFTGVYIGPLFDKYGPRWLILPGTVILVASLVFLSFCKVYWHFMLAFGVMAGISESLLFTPSIAAIGHFFKERRGFATGIAATGGSLGGIVMPLMLQSLFGRIGWAWAIRSLALLCLVMSGVANLLLKSRLPPARDASAHPDPRIFRNVPFALTTLGIFLLELSLFIPVTYIATYATQRGFSTSFGSQVVTIMNAGSVVGRLLPGWYADKIGPYNANILAIILAIVSSLGIWLPTSIIPQTHTSPSTGGDGNSAAAAPAVIYALLFGFTSGCNISLTPVSVGRLCATANYGRYYATCYTVVSIGALVGIPIAGTILTSNGGEFWGLITFVSALFVSALMALFAAKISAVGWHPMANF